MEVEMTVGLLIFMTNSLAAVGIGTDFSLVLQSINVNGNSMHDHTSLKNSHYF